MENLINLGDLLHHEILDLYSAEKQIIEALPEMIDETSNAGLRQALEKHLQVTKTHKERLEKAIEMIDDDRKKGGTYREHKSFFSSLFGGVAEPKCKGIEGLINEGRKIVDENMTEEVRDAAIIAAAQKIEHYEISGYGTSLAYCRQLHLPSVAAILKQNLDEEYEADDTLTQLAVERLNVQAENATDEYHDDIDMLRADLNVTPDDFEGKSLLADYAKDVTPPITNEDINPESRNF